MMTLEMFSSLLTGNKGAGMLLLHIYCCTRRTINYELCYVSQRRLDLKLIVTFCKIMMKLRMMIPNT